MTQFNGKQIGSKTINHLKEGGGGGIPPKKYVYFTDYLNVITKYELYMYILNSTCSCTQKTFSSHLVI